MSRPTDEDLWTRYAAAALASGGETDADKAVEWARYAASSMLAEHRSVYPADVTPIDVAALLAPMRVLVSMLHGVATPETTTAITEELDRLEAALRGAGH